MPERWTGGWRWEYWKINCGLLESQTEPFVTSWQACRGSNWAESKFDFTISKQSLHFEIQVMVRLAVGVEFSITCRACHGWHEIFCNGHFMMTLTAKDNFQIPIGFSPSDRLVSSRFLMAGIARKILLTTSKLDCNNVKEWVVVNAPGLVIGGKSINNQGWVWKWSAFAPEYVPVFLHYFLIFAALNSEIMPGTELFGAEERKVR